MPNAKTAKETANHRILVLGDTGSGKTTQFLTIPGKKFAYLFDSNALLSLRGSDVEYEEFLPDQINLSIRPLGKGKPADSTTNHQNQVYVEWEKDFDARVKDGFFNDYDAICLDSATTLLDLIMDRQLTLNGRAGQWPQQDDWGPQMIAFHNIVRTLTALGKTIYMTGHLDTRQDETTKRIMRQPMMTGRLKTKIPLLFSDIFIANAENDGKGSIKYTFQTVPDRITTTVRTSIRGLDPYEDVTLDFKKPLEDQGLGGILKWDKQESAE